MARSRPTSPLLAAERFEHQERHRRLQGHARSPVRRRAADRRQMVPLRDAIAAKRAGSAARWRWSASCRCCSTSPSAGALRRRALKGESDALDQIAAVADRPVRKSVPSGPACPAARCSATRLPSPTAISSSACIRAISSCGCPKKDRARFSANMAKRIFEPMKGRPMREYVRLPEELLADARKRAPWINRSLEYAEGVTPKKSREKSKAKSASKK